MPFWPCIGLGLDSPLAPKTKSCQGFGELWGFLGGGRDNAEQSGDGCGNRVGTGVGRVPCANSANNP